MPSGADDTPVRLAAGAVAAQLRTIELHVASPRGTPMKIHARLVALSAAVLLPAALQAQTPAASTPPREDRWTPELSMKFRGIQSTAVSPAGDRIAYVINQPVMEGEKSE